MDIFDEVNEWLESGKDFPPEMVGRLVQRYEAMLAFLCDDVNAGQTERSLTKRAVDGGDSHASEYNSTLRQLSARRVRSLRRH